MGECLRSVLREVTGDDRVVLVDNASTDGSVSYVAKRFPNVDIMRFQRNLGFAEAYNRAVSAIGEDYAVLLNNDVVVDNGWLEGLRKGLGDSKSVVACGSRLMSYRKRGLTAHAGGSLTTIGAGIDTALMEDENRNAGSMRFVGCVSGASMIVSKRKFLALGGFDSEYFAYLEDVDFCWRAWLFGYRVLFVPDSIVYHKMGATAGPRSSPSRAFWGERNRLLSMFKNLEWQNLALALILSLSYTFARLLYFIRIGRYQAASALVRANWEVIRLLPSLMRKRRSIQARRRVSDRFLLEHGLMTPVHAAFREFLRLERLGIL